ATTTTAATAASAAASAGDRCDHGRLTVLAAVDGDRLAGREALRACDGDRSRAHFGGRANGRAACCANSGDRGGLAVRSGVDDDRLAGCKIGDAGNFDI